MFTVGEENALEAASVRLDLGAVDGGIGTDHRRHVARDGDGGVAQ